MKIVLGPPGTGKTTYLMGLVESYLEQGYEPEEIAFLAFTRRAAKVAIQRAVQRFGLDRGRFKHFRTLHSYAYQHRKFTGLEVMQSHHYQEFGREYSYVFTGRYDGRINLDTQVYGSALGDKLLQCYELSKANKVHPEVEARSKKEYLFDGRAIRRFVENFEYYKKTNGLIAFDDFMSLPIPDPEIKKVIIDEAQDLTKQQWDFIMGSFDRDHMTVAGDDDQCIYEWSGANLNYFLGLKGKIHPLQQSWRCSKMIWQQAHKIIKPVRHRYPKTWEPKKGSTGLVRFIPGLDELDFNDRVEGSTGIIARRNKDLTFATKILAPMGANIKRYRVYTSETESYRACMNYERIRLGEPISRREMLDIHKHVTNLISPQASFDDVTWEQCRTEVDRSKPWYEICNKMEVDRRKQFMALNPDFKVTLSTIHGVKGDEFDNVILLSKLRGVPLKHAKENPDQERRVWYVAVTRAKDNLIIAGPENRFL